MAKFIPALMLVVCLASALRAQEMTKPLGKWERKIGKNHVTLIVDENRLHITYAGDKPGTLHADYAMTRDGLIYGVVTSIECDEDEEADATKTLFDAPFSFRFRIDEGALIIHDAKAHDADSNDDLWNGRYKVVRPTTTRAAVVPTTYYEVSPYLVPGPSPFFAPPPCPIAPSFSSPKEGQSNQPKSPTERETIFNFWMGYSR
jgi:hypothetical protein